MSEQALLSIRAELGTLDEGVRARLRTGVLDLVGLDADGVATITMTSGSTEPIVLDTLGEADDIIDLTDRPLERPRKVSRSGGPQRGRVLLAAATVFVALLVGAIALSRQSGRTTTELQATLATATTNDELIIALGQAPDTPLGDGRYDYQRVESAIPANDGRMSLHTNQRWVTNQNTGRAAQTDEQLLASNAPGAASTAGLADGFDSPFTSRDAQGFGTYTFDQIRSLPTEPLALRAQLFSLAKVKPTETAALYDRIAELLTVQSTPPAVRVGLARILVADGATVLGQVRDRAGRQGLGIAVPLPDGNRLVFVLDATTYHRFGDFTVPATGPTTADAASAWHTVLDNVIVDSPTTTR